MADPLRLVSTVVVLVSAAACSRGVSTSTTSTAPQASAAAAAAGSSSTAPLSAASVDASAPDAFSSNVAPRFDKAVLLGNGHVLMPTKDFVYDWDPFAAGGAPKQRRVSLGDAGPAHTFSFVPLGGKNFVVAKTDESDNVRFELWDAEKLTFTRALGTYVAEDPIVDFSRDGKRMMLLACAAPKSKARICDVGVYDLASGNLVHRTKLPPLTTHGPNRVIGRISPTGKYFAVSGDDFATEAYDAENGRRLFQSDAARVGDEVEIDDNEETAQIVHFAFVDDRRILTANTQAGLRLTDLASGQSKTYGFGSTMAIPAPGLLGNSFASSDLRVVVSPDRMRVATEISPKEGSGFAVVVVSFDGSDTAQRTHFIPVPRRVCSSLCAMRWSAPRELVLNPNVEGTPLEFRINAVTGSGVTQPYRDPPPFDVFEAHFVRGDFDKYAKDAKDAKDGKDGKWRPEDRSKTYPKGALVTPRGARIDLATLDMGALMSAAGDRFFIDSVDGLRLIKSDGATASLSRAPVE